MANEFALEIKRRLQDVDYIPASVSKLPTSFGNMDFKLARRCIKKIYADTKTLDQYLQENGVLSMPVSENMEMLECAEILKARYQKAEYLLTKVGDLIAENPDLPVRKLNKYIREVIGEPKIEKYYIKNSILKGKDTDLNEYVFCDVVFGYGTHPFFYISTLEDLRVGEKVIVEFGWQEKLIGEVVGITTCLGIDAPWPVSKTSEILRKARTEEIKNNKVIWTDDDKWSCEWKRDDYREDYLSQKSLLKIDSNITFLESKRSLVELVQKEQTANTVYASPLNDKSMCPAGMFDEVGLKAGSYVNGRTFCLTTRIHNTANRISVSGIEKLKVGDDVFVESNENICVKDNDGSIMGYLSHEISAVLLPMIKKEYASIIEAKVSYVRPLSKMHPSKQHSALYVSLVIGVVNLAKDMEEGCSVALYGEDWKARALKISELKTYVPLDVAEMIFNLYKQCPYRKSFRNYCKDKMNENVEKYGKIGQYVMKVPGQKMGDDNLLYEIFSHFAVDENIYYFVKNKEVDYAIWDAFSYGGFYHWSDKIVLNDINSDDWMFGIGIDEFILSEG